MAKRDFYETLGVSKTVTEAELKVAFRKAAMQYHPDRNPSDKTAETKFKEVNEAYQCLSDSQKRAAYDRFGHAAFEQGGAGGMKRRLRLVDVGHLRRPVRRHDGAKPRRTQRRPRARLGSPLQHGDFPRGGLSGQDRHDQDSDLDLLRGLFRHRRQSRLETEDLRDLRRTGSCAGPAGFLRHRAHLPHLRRPRRGDREPMLGVRRIRPRLPRPVALRQRAGRCRGRHPDQALGRGRGRAARRPRRATCTSFSR